jgi:hypothetical protein
MYPTMTLRQWQSTVKPVKDIIYNASECVYGNDLWVPFTIGVSVWYANVSQENITKTQIGTHDKLLHCAFAEYTDGRRRPSGKNRASILRTLGQHGFQNVNMSHTEYFETLPEYKFVASPEGNGIDCHRHYEALMAGCIPIIENHAGIAEKYSGCPVLFTDDYSEITEEYLNRKYEEMIDQTYDFSKLFLSTYNQFTQGFIRYNGNFWGKKLIGSEWYK